MENKKPRDSSRLIGLFAALHLLCCGIPLLLLSGLSLAFLVPSWPVIGSMLALLSGVGFVWYLRRGCATCPRKEGGCEPGSSCTVAEKKQDQR